LRGKVRHENIAGLSLLSGHFLELQACPEIIWKKASFPPLGLLTVAAMLPAQWEKKLVDLNVAALTDQQIKWADYVFISAMVVQKESVKEIVSRCNQLGVKVVAGGPLFSTDYEEFEGVDHFFLGEA
jgi:hypothetical protein